MIRTTKMTAEDVRQRAGAAEEHLQVAEERLSYVDGKLGVHAEAQVSASNAISAGIAAADAICGATLGERANDQDHLAAVSLLGTVRPNGAALSTKLRRLLRDKTLLQYGGYCTVAVARNLFRDADGLVAALSKYGIRPRR